MNWTSFLEQLNRFPQGTHVLRPACAEEEITRIEHDVGKLPNDLRGLLRNFSGGELFIRAMPMITVFGAPHPSGESKVEWPSVCWLTEQVKLWHGAGRPGWPFAM